MVFCGTAAGPTSARLRQYYAGPGNRFWPTLHRVGLTPALIAPADFARVLEHGIGLTDVVKFASGVDADLDPEHLGDLARAALHERVLAAAPRFLAFTSKRAAAAGLGEIDGYGVQRRTLGETKLWVLPSPSGAATRWWDEGPWRELALQVTSPEGRGRAKRG